MLRGHLPDRLHHVHRERQRDRSALAAACPGTPPDQSLYVSGEPENRPRDGEDEDVCLHCGLCAERCPTGAWDMQKFLIEADAGGARVSHGAQESGVD